MLRKLLLIALLCANTLAYAAGNSEIIPITPSPAAKRIIDDYSARLHAKVRGWFKGPGELQGVAIMMAQKAPVVMFVDKDGKFLVSGIAMNLQNGKNLMIEATTYYFPQFAAQLAKGQAFSVNSLPNAVPLNISDEELAQLHYIETGRGTSPAIAYVFVDMECDHCISVMNALVQSHEVNGRIRWVPVASENAMSEGKSAYALTKKDLVAAMRASSKDLATEATKNQADFARMAANVVLNKEFANAHQFTARPYFVYRKNGAMVGHAGFAATNGLAKALGVN
jgi:hypothetical protein